MSNHIDQEKLDMIIKSVRSFAGHANTTPQKAFAAWYALSFLNADNEEELKELIEFDKGEDQGIDLIYADKKSSQVFVLQAHFPENTSKITPKNKWDSVIASIPPFENPEIFKNSGREEMYEYIDDLKKNYKEFDIVFGLISLGSESASIKKNVDTALKSDSMSNYDFFYSSQGDIINKYTALMSSERSVTDDYIVFDTDCVEDKGVYGRAWFGTVSGSELIRMHNTHKDNLFSGNVRLFMGARKGGINEHIVKTAKDDPGLFWALNNGISIVADAVEATTEKKKLRLHRFSIVNGCQTTSCIANANAKDAKVLVRIIEAAPGIANEIVRYNNSQNPVKIWAVRSVDSNQEALRNEFKKYNIAYAPKQGGRRSSQDKSKPVSIELDKMAQYLASTKKDYLVQAVNAKTELFDQPYQDLFTHDTKANYVYLFWLVGSMADEVRQTMLHSQTNAKNPDKTSIALLGVSATYWIVFCASKILEKEISAIKSCGLEKMVSPDFGGALKKYVDRAADFYFDVAIDTYEPNDFGTVRSALRSPKFLQKFDQKANNKLLRPTQKNQVQLPSFAQVIKSISPKKPVS